MVPGLDVADAAEYFEALRQRVAAIRVPIGDAVLSMTVSIGLCGASSSHDTLHAMLAEADRHLYLAKAGGRNQVRYAA